MRCLCLHGSGASSKILESQLAPLMSSLPVWYEFDFLDAPFECEAAPEVRGIYPGPYSCFFEQYSTTAVARAVDYVREVIEEDGPYECLIGFSQGAAVAAAYMADASRRSQQMLEAPIKMGVFICTGLVNPKVTTSSELIKAIESLGRVDVPTVHVIGLEDLCYTQGTQLVQSCVGQTARVIVHEGAHDMPRDATNTAKIAQAIEQGKWSAF